MNRLTNETLDYLCTLQFITPEQKERIARAYANEVFSLYHELRWTMAIGVVLLLSGIVAFAVNTINTIGQQILVVVSFALSAGFFIGGRHAARRSTADSLPASSHWSILFSCLSLGMGLGYWQYAYAPLDVSWDVVAGVLGIVYLIVAYAMAHPGALALALVSIGISIGLASVPLSMILKGRLPHTDLISVGYAYGALMLILGAWFSNFRVRRAFVDTYVQVGAHFLFVSTLSGLVAAANEVLFVLMLLILWVSGVFYARRVGSFSLLLVTSAYGYLGLAYVISRVIADPTLQAIYIVISWVAVMLSLWTFRTSQGE